MKHKIELDDTELKMVLAALAAVTPSGGGGALNTLFMKLGKETGFKVEDVSDHLDRVIDFQRTAANEISPDDF